MNVLESFEKKGDTIYTLLKMRTYSEACIGTPVIDQSRGPAVSWRISCCRSSGSRIMRNYKIYANRRRKRTVSIHHDSFFFFPLDTLLSNFLIQCFSREKHMYLSRFFDENVKQIASLMTNLISHL